MKKQTKILALALVMAILLSLAAACSDNGGGTTPTPAPPGTTTPEQPPAQVNPPAGGDELPFVELDWYVGFMRQDLPDLDMVVAEAEAYILEKLNTKVNFISMTGPVDWQERMPVLLSAGTDFGITTIGPYFGVNYTQHASQGAFLDLEPLLDQYAPTVKSLFPDYLWDAMRVDGKIYGIPTLKDNCYPLPGIYNYTLTDELGMDLSGHTFRNMMQMEPLLMEVKEKRDELYPDRTHVPLIRWTPGPAFLNFAFDNFTDGMFGAIGNIAGVNDFAGFDNKTVFNMFETREYLEYAQTMRRLRENMIIRYDDIDRDWAGYQNEGLFFFWIGWGLFVVPEDMFSANFSVRIMENQRIWVDTSIMSAAGNAISARCENPERALMVLELMNSDPYLATMLRFGLEGEHWEINSAGAMELVNRNADPAARGFLNWYGATLGNLSIVNAPESHSGPNNAMMDLMVQANLDALPGHMGFRVNLHPIETELAACTAVQGEYMDILTHGRLPTEQAVIDYVNEFNEKLYANGLQKIIDEIQSQLNAWLASR